MPKAAVKSKKPAANTKVGKASKTIAKNTKTT